jgi:pentalenene oxygenase
MPAKTVFAGSLDDAVFRRLRSDLSVVMNGVGVRLMLPDCAGRLPLPSTADSTGPGPAYAPPYWAERLPLPFNRPFDRARAGVRTTVNTAVEELQASGHDTTDMLSMLLRAVDEETGEP